MPTIQLVVRSIRFRLAVWFAAILAVVLVSFSTFVYVSQARDLQTEARRRLDYTVRKLENYLHYAAYDYFEGKRKLTTVVPDSNEALLQESDILALIGLEGELVQKVGPISEEDVEALAKVGIERGIYQNPFSYTLVEASTEGRLIREAYVFIIAPVSGSQGVLGSLILGRPVDPTGQLRGLLLTLVFGNLATVALALVGGYWLADRAMRPVQKITHTARAIGESDLSRRLNLNSRDELGELADTFDGMLDRLEAAFERQRQFTADASHELRTPLTIINLETNRALAVRRSPGEYERALKVIRSENDLMTHLVTNLLTLSRMDAGQTTFQFEVLDLSDVTFEVVERLAPLAEQREVTLSTGELPELHISGDRQFLNQMITNLVENAIKYSGENQPHVSVETGFDPAQPGVSWAWLRVEDNGPGIPAEHLVHLFDRFYQVDPARSHNPDGQFTAGSGLGLSIVQHIAQAHHGTVQVESEVGKGTVFTVRLPVTPPKN